MNRIYALFNENGGPYAVFVLGHVKPDTAISEDEQDRVAASFETTREELFGIRPPQLFYLRRQEALRGCDQWQQCHPDAPGAVAVTGVLCS